MTEERLAKLSIQSLQEIAANEGIKHIEELDKEDLIEQILEAMEEDKFDRDNSNNSAIKIEEKKYAIIRDEEIEAQEKAEYCIPEKYQTTSISLLLRDPYWAFAFWDIKDSDLEEMKTKKFRGLTLRVYQIEREMDVVKKDSLYSFDIPVKPTDDKWYINLPESGKKYYLELISRIGYEEKVLCASNPIESPVYTIANSIIEENLSHVSGPMLAFAGLYELPENGSKGNIPQRIIQFIEANNFNFKQ